MARLPVGSQVSTGWWNRKSVESNIGSRWRNQTISVGSEVSSSWRKIQVRPVGTETTTVWRNLQVGSENQTTWKTLKAVGCETTARWGVQRAVASEVRTAWNAVKRIARTHRTTCPHAGIVQGESLTLRAYVPAGANGPASGVVDFYLVEPERGFVPTGPNLRETGTYLGSATVNGNGYAVLHTRELVEGEHTIVSLYRGDERYYHSHASLAVTVGQAADTTGCNGPYCHGTGGWCGCDCKCCPPPCCSSAGFEFECGPPQSDQNPKGCPPPSAMNNWGFRPPQPMPRFTRKGLRKGRFTFSASSNKCSFPCETICVEVSPGGPAPVCCLEVVSGSVLAVGNGWVDAPTEVDGGGCKTLTVMVNGKVPPVFVNDCDSIDVTLTPEEDCCSCNLTKVSCGCGDSGLRLFRKETQMRMLQRFSRTKINPLTGKPAVVLDRAELKRRLEVRLRNLRKRKK